MDVVGEVGGVGRVVDLVKLVDLLEFVELVGLSMTKRAGCKEMYGVNELSKWKKNVKREINKKLEE